MKKQQILTIISYSIQMLWCVLYIIKYPNIKLEINLTKLNFMLFLKNKVPKLTLKKITKIFVGYKPTPI